MIKNAYIHIPFCKSKCNYCSFISFEKLSLIDKYFLALKQDIDNFYTNEKLETIYFGGGTPSVVSIENLKTILNLFNFDVNPEMTIEVNPNDASDEYLKSLFDIGFNRISFGVQTFDDSILKTIGRRHTSSEAIKAVLNAKEAGFNNISVDMIYGLPNQNSEGFERDLKTTLDLDIQHVSFYGLKIEEGCYFYKNMPENLPNSDEQADMYELGCEFLTNSGFEHYEISNFSKNGFNSRHNLNYWNNNSYYGFGVAAHGYDCENRYANLDTLERYIKNPFIKSEIKEISIQEQLEEEIFLGLRKGEGINLLKINKQFNINFNKKYSEILEKYSDYFIKTDNNISLTTKGFLISNEILSEFIE